MAAASVSPLSLSLSFRKTHLEILPSQLNPSLLIANDKQSLIKSKLFVAFQNVDRSSRLLSIPFPSAAGGGSSNRFLDTTEESEILPSIEERPVKFILWVVFWTSVSLAWFAASGDANAAADSIKASTFGLKIASSLRGLGWRDEAVVFALATLPVLELRGAIPVGYWMQLKPVELTLISIIGNMIPVPFIVLYLKRLASFLARRNQAASRFLQMLFDRAKEKAGPVEEFQGLGLMLFVAVPFPGTGVWTGAIIASILDMPFWTAVLANFLGVVLAGLLVNLLVNLGHKYAIVTGIILFVVSTIMWSLLRNITKCLKSQN